MTKLSMKELKIMWHTYKRGKIHTLLMLQVVNWMKNHGIQMTKNYLINKNKLHWCCNRTNIFTN